MGKGRKSVGKARKSEDRRSSTSNRRDSLRNAATISTSTPTPAPAPRNELAKKRKSNVIAKNSGLKKWNVVAPAGPRSAKIAAAKIAAARGRKDKKEVKEEKEYEVEEVLGVQFNGNAKEYLVRWLGYQVATWEPEENLGGSTLLVNEFLNRL